ncbi:MAG: hypothetical protein JWN77_550 [Frankiales bacterium]|jgi:hypothetical protein|nr:hypothetical protein [Frankiales bacterium]
MYQLLVLTNQGATCSLRGFPGLSFLDAAGRQVGSPAAMSSAPRRRVLLRPGGSATAQLAIRTARNYPDSDCAPRPATRLRVYPPGQRVPLTAADPADVCSVRTARQLTVGPVSPG